MPEARAELSFGNLDNVLFELVRQAVRAEIQEISRRNEDSLLTIDQVAQTLSVSKDWVYRKQQKTQLYQKPRPSEVVEGQRALMGFCFDRSSQYSRERIRLRAIHTQRKIRCSKGDTGRTV